MNKKGYSLVELLTVFILLGIIAGIVYVLTDNIKKDAKMETLKTSAKKLFVIADNYDAQNDYKGFPVGGVRIDQLDIESTSFTGGKIKVNTNGEYELVNVTDGTYCINGTLSDLKFVKEACPEMTISPVDGAVAAYIYLMTDVSNLPMSFSEANALIIYVDEDNNVVSLGEGFAAQSTNQEEVISFYDDLVVSISSMVENPTEILHYYINKRDNFSYVAGIACEVDGINYCNGNKKLDEVFETMDLDGFTVVQIVF